MTGPCRQCGPGYRIGDEGCRHSSGDVEAVLAGVLAGHAWGGYIGPPTVTHALGRYARCRGCDWISEYDPADLFGAWQAHVAAEQAKALAVWAQQDEVVERATNAAVYLNAYAARKVLTAIFGGAS
ncbi:MAG TPA: hypothetical protein VJW23_10025 [Propionibacteriaceae bacterium]|nr:hypothetical protein [Propionibacteriaceae bacterium]